jgi:hypothetical protein
MNWTNEEIARVLATCQRLFEVSGRAQQSGNPADLGEVNVTLETLRQITETMNDADNDDATRAADFNLGLAASRWFNVRDVLSGAGQTRQ